jgi:hypothetical protein
MRCGPAGEAEAEVVAFLRGFCSRLRALGLLSLLVAWWSGRACGLAVGAEEGGWQL